MRSRAIAGLAAVRPISGQTDQYRDRRRVALRHGHCLSQRAVARITIAPEKAVARTCLTLLIALSPLEVYGCGEADDVSAFDEPARACAASEDCRPSEECSAGHCVRYTSCSGGQACAAGQRCEEGVCRWTCSSEKQCEEVGLTCDLASGNCVPKTGAIGADASGSGGASGNGGAGGEEGGGAGGVGGLAGASGTSSGGTSGSGGAPDSGSNLDLIDDLEDNDSAIRQIAGRQGSWYVFNDGQGTQTPALGAFTPFTGGAQSSRYATHTWGQGFSDWGAGIAVDLNNPGDQPQDPRRGTYDVSSWQGFSFQAKGTGAVRFMVITRAVADAVDHGTCEPEPDRPCFDAHGARTWLTADWTQQRIRFSDLAQEGWGVSASFDAAQVLGVSFQHPEGADVTNKAAPFDFWIDDLALFRD
jgi:hypothetical protein